MILGTVSPGGIPSINVLLASQEWVAVIDTGFNGDLELPLALQDLLDARYVGRVASALAAGQSVEEDVFLMELPFDGQVMEAEVTFAPTAHALIGTHLLRGHSLQIDFLGKTVRVERP